MPQLHIDPYAWMVTLPLAAAMFWLHLQPDGHAIKRMWHVMDESQSQGWAMLTGRDVSGFAPPTAFTRAMYWAMAGLLVLGTAASLSAFLHA